MSFEETVEKLSKTTLIHSNNTKYNYLRNDFKDIEDNLQIISIDSKESDNKPLDETIQKQIIESDIIFIVMNLGSKNEVEAAIQVANISKKSGVLTIGIAVQPSSIEGEKEIELEQEEIEHLKNHMDSLIIIDNNRFIQEEVSLEEVISLSNNTVTESISGIVNLISIPGIINLDIKDIRVILSGNKFAYIGTAIGEGKGKAVTATEAALNSPLLVEQISRASGVILNVTGGEDMMLSEINDVAEIVQQAVPEDANIILGSVVDDDMEGIKVTVVAS